MARAGDGQERSGIRRLKKLVSVRLNDADYATLGRRAEAAGMTKPAYLAATIKQTAGTGNTTGKVNASDLIGMRQDLIDLIGHIKPLGNNLNQIAKRLNAGGNAAPSYVIKAATETSALIADITKLVESMKIR